MDVEKQLKAETGKWLEKLEKAKIEAKSEKGNEYKKNIKAYIKDSKHFTNKGDFVRAFEAVVWAWAFLEIAEDLGLLKRNQDIQN